MTCVASCSPSLPEVNRHRAFGLTVLARLGKNSSVQKAGMTILHLPCERATRGRAVLVCADGTSPLQLAAPHLERLWYHKHTQTRCALPAAHLLLAHMCPRVSRSVGGLAGSRRGKTHGSVCRRAHSCTHRAYDQQIGRASCR